MRRERDWKNFATALSNEYAAYLVTQIQEERGRRREKKGEEERRREEERKKKERRKKEERKKERKKERKDDEHCNSAYLSRGDGAGNLAAVSGHEGLKGVDDVRGLGKAVVLSEGACGYVLKELI